MLYSSASTCGERERERDRDGERERGREREGERDRGGDRDRMLKRITIRRFFSV